MSDAAKPTSKPLPAKTNGGLRAKQGLLETPATFPLVPALSTLPSEVLRAAIEKAKKPVLAVKTADPLVGRPNAQGHKPHTAALNPHLSSHPNRKLGRKQ
jgi:hypothetical protein